MSEPIQLDCYSTGPNDGGSYHPTIVSVALRSENGMIFTLPKPHRHHHVLHSLVLDFNVDRLVVQRMKQGFLDCNGSFVDRRTAKIHAMANDQMLKPSVQAELFSEDLW